MILLMKMMRKKYFIRNKKELLMVSFYFLYLFFELEIPIIFKDAGATKDLPNLLFILSIVFSILLFSFSSKFVSNIDICFSFVFCKSVSLIPINLIGSFLKLFSNNFINTLNISDVLSDGLFNLV